MKTLSVVAATLILMLGSLCFIGIIIERHTDDRNELAAGLTTRMNEEAMKSWSPGARERWMEVVEAPVRAKRRNENLNAITGAAFALASAAYLYFVAPRRGNANKMVELGDDDVEETV